MERERIIDDLHGQIESLTRLHTLHGLHNTEGFRKRRESIQSIVGEYNVDIRRELRPETLLLYRRYFE